MRLKKSSINPNSKLKTYFGTNFKLAVRQNREYSKSLSKKKQFISAIPIRFQTLKPWTIGYGR
jgi:hypothetical protein